MDEHIFDKVDDVDLKKMMEKSFVEYAMSVIASRALPDVRDGLKPVQRRILHAMNELNNGPDKPHRKCARIVGDTMGKYHPHGDSSIYGALVCLAQDWNTRYPLVDGHGNFGSVDGDGAAAMRYTEARLSKISVEMLADINKDTVDMLPNFDDTEKEPAVLPARYPNLLVNGTTGIAVGMATNIPPHNLRETIDAVVRIIDNKIEGEETTIEELMSIIKGPDFPTGAQILGTRGIEEAYRTGRGKIRVRAVSTIEPMDNGKHRIIVTELPYLVNKARLIEKIAELHKDKKVDGITDLRDESDQKGMRVVIELKKEANPTVVLNHLYKHTQLQDTFGVIMLALVNNEPKVLNLLQMLNYYLLHQEEVVTRRTKYDLNKAEEREHIMEALLKALDFIDEVIQIIRSSKTTAEAKQRLMDRFEFDDVQAQAIVDMRLRQLTGLERSKLEEEFAALEARIAEYRKILSDEKELLSVIKTEIIAIRDRYGDDRRTSIGFDESDFNAEDLIPDDATIIAMSRKGYIKRMSPEAFRTQNRGGKGIKGMQTIEEDFIERLLMTTNHHNLLFFTNLGRVYRLKAYEIPEASRTARGTAVINLIQLMPGESVTAMIPVRDMGEDGYLFMATKRGIIKKTKLAAFANIRKVGIIAISLREDDQLIDVKVTNDTTELMLITKQGAAVRFRESDVRATGRNGMGVYGMRLAEDDDIVSMIDTSEAEHVLFISENGYGKRTAPEEFALHHRGGKGMRCYKIVDKSGPLVGARMVDDTDEVIMITNEGILIRIPVSSISILGRSTSGVKCMNIDAESDIRVANFAKVCETAAYEIPGLSDGTEGLEEDAESEDTADTEGSAEVEGAADAAAEETPGETE
ncbi:MAG: DNA gyrase subunit A [Lachnospiraceae bacterium]|nr:DNA gyrase subunit A [Lachnospiraceae bacterium]MBR6018645.1 DNA gyrase subunit A [Lachnospiraceae bacterium]